jgi:hypothetical protein
MREFLKTKNFRMSAELQSFVSYENTEKFKILELKTESLVHSYDELSPRPPIGQTLASHQKGHFANIAYVILAALLSVGLYFSLCFDGVTYKNIVTMINVKFKGHYDLAAIQRKTSVLLSAAMRPQEFKFDYGTLTELQSQINSADITPILENGLLGYYGLLDEFNFDEKFYDLCSINFMEEFAMIIDICKTINKNTKSDASDSIANQLTNLETEHSSAPIETKEPTPPYVSGSSFKGLYYLSSRNLQTQVVEKINGVLSSVFSGAVSSKNSNIGCKMLDSLITNYLHVSYLADFIHHFTVNSSDFLFP